MAHGLIHLQSGAQRGEENSILDCDIELSNFPKMSIKHVVGFFLLMMVATGCQQSKPEHIVYSFFIAGHTYGNPNGPQLGLYPSFVDFFETLNADPKMELGFLTGDVVAYNSAEYWDSAQVDIDKLDMPVHIAAGNHDIGDEFVKRFEKYYYSFTHKGDLFIILTPGLDDWNITGEQLEFLKKTLDLNSPKVDNIFIFLHELIWWNPDNEYKDIAINYKPHYPGSSNWDDLVKPLLLSFSNSITVFAGDLGATSQVSSVMYDQFDNITLIGSGMGGGKNDNVIITHVFRDSISYELICINGKEPGDMGKLEDHNISN